MFLSKFRYEQWVHVLHLGQWYNAVIWKDDYRGKARVPIGHCKIAIPTKGCNHDTTTAMLLLMQAMYAKYRRSYVTH